MMKRQLGRSILKESLIYNFRASVMRESIVPGNAGPARPENETLLSNDAHNELFYGGPLARESIAGSGENEYAEFFAAIRDPDTQQGLARLAAVMQRSWYEAPLIVAFALTIVKGDVEAFRIVRQSSEGALKSLCLSLMMEEQQFTLEFLSQDVVQRHLIIDFALVELVCRGSVDIARYMMNGLSAPRISTEALEVLVRHTCLDIIQRLLQRDAKLIVEDEACKVTFRDLTVLEVIKEMLWLSTDTVVFRFIKASHVKLNEKLIQLISDHGRFSVLAGLNKYFIPNMQTIYKAIGYGAFEYVLSNRQYLLDYTYSGTSPLLLAALVSSCESFDNIEIKIYLVRLTREYYSQGQVNKLFQILDAAVEKLAEHPSIFDYTHNPVKLAVLIIELVSYFGTRFRILHGLYMKIKRKLIDFVISIVNEFRDAQDLRLVLLEQDLSGRELLVLIEQLKLYSILSDKKMPILVETIWSTKYNTSNTGILAFASMYNLLVNSSLSSRVDMEAERRLSPEKGDAPLNSLGFYAWRSGIFLRYLSQSVVYFILATISQILVYNFLIVGEEYYDNENNVGQVALRFYTDLRLFLKFTAVWLLFPVKVMFDTLFKHRAKRTYPTLTGEFFLLLFQLLLILLLYWEDSRMESLCQNFDPLNETFAMCFCREFWTGYRGETWVFLKEIVGLLMICVWGRAIMSLNVSQLLGPTATYAIYLMKDLLRFTVFFMMMSVAAACFFGLLLIQNDDFKNVFKSLYTIIMASLQFFDPSTLDVGDQRTVIYGYIFMSIYLFISFLAINLLISIFFSTYSRVEEKQKALNLSQTIALRPVYKYDRRYSYYVSTPFPLSVLLLPSAPFAVFGLDHELINSIMLHIEYFPMLLTLLCTFLLLELLLLPFTYLKMTVHKLLLVLRRSRTTLAPKLAAFIWYLLFGLAISLYQIGVDLVRFVRSLYSPERNVPREDDTRPALEIDPKLLKAFVRYISELKSEVGNISMTVGEIINRYEDYTRTKHSEMMQDSELEALRQTLATLEYRNGASRLVNVPAAYGLMRSIVYTGSYYALTMEVSRVWSSQLVRRSVGKNLNRRLVCCSRRVQGGQDSADELGEEEKAKAKEDK
ncbi:MAG: hypothetical protein P4M11_11830 [Candidatus Pacebacteria bacterium]|nr:hypothetical protein [Candidatus Paceibacterota bacterium]